MTKYHHNKEVREGYPYGSVDEIGNNAPVLKDYYADEHDYEVSMSVWRMGQRDLKQFPLTSPFTGEELIEGKTFEIEYQLIFRVQELNGWVKCSPEEYEKYAPSCKRIVAVPIQKEDSRQQTVEEYERQGMEKHAYEFDSKEEKEMWKDVFDIFLSCGDVYSYDAKKATEIISLKYKISPLNNTTHE